MSVLSKGDLCDKLMFQINEEISVFINYMQENVVIEKESKQLITQEVVPRLSMLRTIISEYKQQENDNSNRS